MLFPYWEVLKKNGIFTVRLTVRVEPPLPYGQLFVIFSGGVRLTLDYDYMCSETDFTQEKSHLHPTTRIPNSCFLLAVALSKMDG